MTTADQLLEQMLSWIEQRESCAKQLKKLAQELESLREKCNASECVGSTVAVAGAACLIGAGVATVLTAGAAAPFLGLLGAAYSGVGVAVSVGTKITEHFLSSNTMKETQNIEQKSNEIAEKIQKLFEQLKAERREVSSFADPDDLDRHIMTEILRAMARRSGLDRKINFRMLEDEPQFSFNIPRSIGLHRVYFSTPVMVGFLGILAFFTFEVSGKKHKFLFAKGVKQLLKLMSTTAFKRALKGGALVVGGAVGMGISLLEAIDNWKHMIKKNHVTEASQSLRDTADAILKMTQTLRGQFDDMKKMFDDLAKSQQEHEEKLSREKNTQDCTEKPEEEESDGEEEGSDQEEEESDEEDVRQQLVRQHLDPHQFAYRPRRGTEDAVACLLHLILQHLQTSGNFVSVLFIDFSSAFNTIHHHQLIKKLHHLNISSPLIHWIHIFLGNRPQTVRIGSTTSSTIITNTGAPQGCVLSPFLYTLYTNDCNSSSTVTTYYKYADDTAIVGLLNNNNSVSAYLDSISQFSQWCQDNYLQ
ncbi:uncharacterized protein LOC114570262 [Perca flavescens]|uniref:uncharacterized protein LOC114570262 n=1 Tax=Perca flavescens TaxID=8167 RepID=UPI00106EB65C|nr:uncharacterized protein LOC114570262 [Perca flavescens]